MGVRKFSEIMRPSMGRVHDGGQKSLVKLWQIYKALLESGGTYSIELDQVRDKEVQQATEKYHKNIPF